MAIGIVVPYTFATQNGPLPLANLDSDILTPYQALSAFATYGNYLVDSSGAANTITVTTPTNTTFSYTAGVPIQVKLANTNTSTSVSINVNGSGSVSVLNADGTNPAVGQLVAAQILPMIFDGAAMRLSGPQSKPSSIAPFTATAAGNVTLPAPTSGTALAVSGVAAANVFAFSAQGSSTAGQSNGILVQAGNNSGSDRAIDVLNYTGTTRLFGVFGDGHFALGYNSAVSTITGTAIGNVSIAAPASGIGLAIGGSTTGNALLVLGNTTTGSSNGLRVQAGTNTGDLCAVFANSASTLNYLVIGGDGGVYVGAPAGADEGIGSFNCVSLYQNGNPVYAGIPQNTQSGNYTLVLSDANKHIRLTGAGPNTFTIPANSSVAYPIGTAITFVNRATGVLSISITTDTLQFSNNNTGGTRVIASNGSATAIKTDPTVWLISGAGIS